MWGGTKGYMIWLSLYHSDLLVSSNKPNMLFTFQINDQPYFFQRLNGGELVELTIVPRVTPPLQAVFGIHYLPSSFPLL